MGNYYINSGLRLPLLSHYLWRQFAQFLGSEGKTTRDSTSVSRLLPSAAMKAVRVSKVLVRFLVARLLHGWTRESKGQSVITLSVPGDFAIVRRSGAVKVLDVDNAVVHTIMGAEERDKLGERIQLSKEVSRFPFAPRVESVDLESGCFSEEFISGSHPLNFEGCREDFAVVYRPLLVEFMRAVVPKWRPLQEYVASLMDEILAENGLLPQLEEEVSRPVVNFVEEIAARLQALEMDVPLVLSHGDYFSGNIVIDGVRHRAIDWANMGWRSPLHDLYYLQMNHCRRVLDHEALKQRTKAAIREVRNALRDEDGGRFEELAGALTTREEYRLLFYLECIQVPLVRCSSVEDRYLASMLVRVSWFSDYERHLAGKRPVDEVVPGTGNTTALKPSGAGNG